MNMMFEDAYKSNLSLVIIDDIERLIEYHHYGGKFCNATLQDLLVTLKKRPTTIDRKIFIVGTTSVPEVM